MRAVAVRRIDSSSFSAYCQNAVAEKLTPIHTKATLQPYRTTATLTDTELQPDGQNEELQRRHDKDGALDRRVTRGRFRRRRSNRVQTGTRVLLRMTPNQHVRGSSVLRLSLRWLSRGASRSGWSVQDPFEGRGHLHVYACKFLAAGCWSAARERCMSVVFTRTSASQLTFRIGSCGALSCQILVVAQLKGRQRVRRITAEARGAPLGRSAPQDSSDFGSSVFERALCCRHLC